MSGGPYGPRGGAPPSIYNGIYTGIYLPTFREGTNFIIKTVSFMSGGPYGPGGVLSDFGGGSPRCILGETPICIDFMANIVMQ